VIDGARLRSRVARGVVTSLVALSLGLAAVAVVSLAAGLFE